MAESRSGARAITLCVCSARPALVRDNLATWAAALAPGDELLVVFDTRDALSLHADCNSVGCGCRLRVVPLGTNRGLSFARTRGLELARFRHVLFMDDDAIVPSATVEAIRLALGAGAHAVGARLDAAFPAGGRPWFLTDGVLHYVGVHSAVTLGSVWGACFAVDRDFARATGIRFQPGLGRRRRRLESGDDSTFIRQLRDFGGEVVFLADAPAVHTVSPNKTTVRYVLRRAWWQGRSEVRRGDWRAGLTKEIRRSWQGASTVAERGVATSCNAAVVAGIVTELATRWCIASRLQVDGEPEVGAPVVAPDDAVLRTEHARARPIPPRQGLP